MKTAMLASGIIVGGMILIAQGMDTDRAEPVPRPAPPSCPFIYSFNGREYVFDSETYAGAVARGLERTDLDNLDHLRAVDGRYRMILADERNESQYTDAVTLVIADHRQGTRVFPDAGGIAHVVGAGATPVHMRSIGVDTFPARAGWEVAFVRPASDSVALVVTARNTKLAPFVLDHLLTLMGRDVYTWYASLDDEATRGHTHEWILSEGALQLSVADGGEWTTLARLPDVGPMIAKAQVVPLSLAGIRGDTIRIRLESSPGLWERPVVELAPYRGVARVHRRSPASATTLDGRDVRELITAIDGRYHVATRGSRVAIEFDAPVAATGNILTPLVRTTGHYYLDADDRGTPRPEIVGRIMSDRGFAQAYFDARWREATGTSLPR
jgi:hypothetical protein